MERITVVKIGGNVIDSPEATARFVEAFAALEGPKLLMQLMQARGMQHPAE